MKVSLYHEIITVGNRHFQQTNILATIPITNIWRCYCQEANTETERQPSQSPLPLPAHLNATERL